MRCCNYKTHKDFKKVIDDTYWGYADSYNIKKEKTGLIKVVTQE